MNGKGWIEEPFSKWYKCPECGFMELKDHDYCPNCGVRLKEKKILCDSCLKNAGCKWYQYFKNRPNEKVDGCEDYIKDTSEILKMIRKDLEFLRDTVKDDGTDYSFGKFGAYLESIKVLDKYTKGAD